MPFSVAVRGWRHVQEKWKQSGRGCVARKNNVAAIARKTRRFECQQCRQECNEIHYHCYANMAVYLQYHFWHRRSERSINSPFLPTICPVFIPGSYVYVICYMLALLSGMLCYTGVSETPVSTLRARSGYRTNEKWLCKYGSCSASFSSCGPRDHLTYTC